MDSLMVKRQEIFGVCTLPLIPGRKEPREASEMVSQLIFGEPYEVLDIQEKWIFVRNSLDHYEFWIDRKMHSKCSYRDHETFMGSKDVLLDPVSRVQNKNTRETLLLSMGSRLPQLDAHGFELLDQKFGFVDVPGLVEPKNIEEQAKKLLNAPYLWGGKSVFGIDCSGYVQIVMSSFGISLPRDAYQQADYGEQVTFRDLIEPGDLVFFDNEEGRITHVGIALDTERIIHASGKVRIDKLDHQGIYNEEISSYTHNTRVIKRIFNRDIA